MSSQHQIVYKFGGFLLNPADKQVLRDGKPVALPPKVFDTLLLLVESHARLVEKDEFLKRLWPDSFVEEVALAHCISHLRKALRDGTPGCTFIETVPKRGYRFVAAVEVVPAAFHEAPEPVRLAVMPFENLGAGPEREYLADGFTEETIVRFLALLRRCGFTQPGETLTRRGYRFIAPANGSSTPGAIGIAAAPVRSKLSFLSRHLVAIACLALIVMGVLGSAVARYPLLRRTEVIERKLTTNSSENSVSSAAVSPDRKFLAFADNTGMFLKQIRTGETHAVPLPLNFSARVNDWFPDGSHLLVSREEQPGKASLWSISVFGGPPRQLADDASGGSVSPDGAHIAFRRIDLTYDGLLAREEWIMRSDGTNPVRVAADKSDGSQVGAPTWSPDSKRIAYIRTNWAYDARTSSVEVNDWQNARTETLFSDNRLTPALHWLSDGRLAFALGNRLTSSRQDSSLFMVSLQQSQKISGSPKRVAQGHGLIVQIAGSSDGKVLIFRSENWSASVYMGTLAADGTHLLENKRLTLDESVSIPYSWTPDSKAVLFNSDRNGTPEIFKQASDRRVAESVMTSAEKLSQPRVTPDGSEILYISTPQSAGPETPSSIFALPITGGTPRLVLKDVRICNVQCARSPSEICLYSVSKGDTLETFRFDSKRGKSSVPPQVDPLGNWSLSPDGSQRAIVPYNSKQGTIQLRSTSTGKTRDLVVKGWSGLMGVDWFSDGKSLLVSWHNHDLDSALLNVALDGRASVLLRSTNDLWAAIPSPDGRFLAIAEASGTKNVWEIENF